MDYYLITPEDEKRILIGSSTPQFNKFWPDHGWELLEKLVEKKPELLEYVNIIREDGNTYNVSQFYQTVHDILTKGETSHGTKKRK